MTNLPILTDAQLLEAYKNAVRLQLEPCFIKLLSEELERRGLAKNVCGTKAAFNS